MIGPLLFQPLYQDRVWGGRGLERALGRALPPGRVIGESWDIVDRPEAQSVVARGPHAGRSLRELVERETEAIMGRHWDARRPFPILVKWLDCQERLSLQVHPPAAVADELHGEPKTENWFVADATPEAALIVGLKRGVTRAAFERALAENTLESLVHRFPVRAGDSILVQSGRLHAIDAGNLILEIQQNSDTTYRVYDWGRVGLDGKPRQLHVAQSLRCIDFNDVEPSPLRATRGDAVLAECPEFRIRRLERADGASFPPTAVAAGGPPEARLLHVVRGAVRVTAGGNAGAPADAAAAASFRAGDNVLLPAAFTGGLRAEGETTVLLTDKFSGGRT
jgi:mannose-6-phosphate isomerase